MVGKFTKFVDNILWTKCGHTPHTNQPVYQPAANQSQNENVGLCDCRGSYCKYCWLGVCSCTSPYVWYKITKALNMGNLVKTVLAVTILVVVFDVLNVPMQYNTPRVPTIHYKCRF